MTALLALLVLALAAPSSAEAAEGEPVTAARPPAALPGPLAPHLIEAKPSEDVPAPTPAPLPARQVEEPRDTTPSVKRQPAASAGLDKYKNLLVEELSILEVLEQLEFAEEKGRDEQKRLEGELDELRQRLAQEEAALASARADLGMKGDSVKEALRRILAARKRRDVAPLLDQDELQNALKSRRYFSKVLDANRKTLTELASLAALYASAVAERQRDLARYEEVRERLKAELAAIDDAIATRKEILRRLESEEGVYGKYQSELATAEKKLTEKIRTLKEWRDQRLGFQQARGQLRPPLQPCKLVRPYGVALAGRSPSSPSQRGLAYEARVQDGEDPHAARVRAVYWGKVVFAGWIRGYGKTVILDHTGGYHSVYAHIGIVQVKEGEVVKSRQTVGWLDAARTDDYRLLYFELRKDGEPFDPSPWMM